MRGMCGMWQLVVRGTRRAGGWAVVAVWAGLV